MNGYVRTAQHGGNGGNSFQDDLTEVCRLIGLNIRAGEYIDALQCIWSTPSGAIVRGTQYGGGGGTLHNFTLGASEYIVTINGQAGRYVDNLSFTTNLGNVFGPVGGDGGTAFTLTKLNVGGFFGQSGDLLDAIGAFTLGQC